ncbi:hypothetical protein PVAG01_08198 [Phlyctema vagabunda]|uniref:F-box domain-containing protein n=1 Tax=Phlyctema vagabunda TaxID=108571 RepID=A0ABR4P8T8_9HELO
MEVGPEAGAECCLFRIPLEIRNEIYRYLLLPYTYRPIGLNQLGDQFSKNKIRTWDFKFVGPYDPDHLPTYTEVLRVNRRINAEASRVFYSETTIQLEPGDITSMLRTSDISPPYKHVWQHNPLQGFGHKKENGCVTYDTPDTGGRLAPHVFARFEKVWLDLTFNWSLGAAEPSLDDNNEVVKSTADLYLKGLKSSRLIKCFVRVLAHSNHIRQLSVSLNIDVASQHRPGGVSRRLLGNDLNRLSDEDISDILGSNAQTAINAMVNTAAGSETPDDDNDDDVSEDLGQLAAAAGSEKIDTDGDDDDDDDFEDFEATEATLAEMEEEELEHEFRGHKLNEKVTELFLESGILAPLLMLTNVKSFDLDFRNFWTMDGTIYIPPEKHRNIIQKVKGIIEARFKPPTTSRPAGGVPSGDTPKRNNTECLPEESKRSMQILPKAQ